MSDFNPVQSYLFSELYGEFEVSVDILHGLSVPLLLQSDLLSLPLLPLPPLLVQPLPLPLLLFSPLPENSTVSISTDFI